MPRAIDHLVIPAHDLEAQADLYRRLGFQVGPRNRHPWGTENHIIQFDGEFLELIALGEGFETPVSKPAEFSFAGFVARYLHQREGLAMLVMRSNDAEADRRDFARQGLGEFERFYFARKARRPNGETVDVAFTLAFAASSAFPDTGFFVCQQHFPLNFWSRAAQVHPNGALGLASLTFVHEAPERARDFLHQFIASPARAVADGFVFEAENAQIECRPPLRAAERARAPGLVAMRILVDDLGQTEKALGKGGARFARQGADLVVEDRDAMGVRIVFAAN